jgi:hypothetical protein
MPGTRPNPHYVLVWKSQMPGASDTWLVEVEGYAKRNDASGPFCVANEYVASRIGQAMGIPVPAGAVVYGMNAGESPAWMTLAVTKAGEVPPPADGAEVVAAHPDKAAGIVVFDILIGNTDRHSQNLSFVSATKRLDVYDHSHAVLGDGGISSKDRLDHLRDRLAIDGKAGAPLAWTNRHVLLDHLTNGQQLLAWMDEVPQMLGDRLLARVCEEIVELEVGVTDEQADGLNVFLTHRRDNIRTIVDANKGELTNMDWGIGV